LSDIDLDVILEIPDNGVMGVPACEVCKRFLEEVGDILRRVFPRETNLDDIFDLIGDGEMSELEEACSRVVENAGSVLRDMLLKEPNLEDMANVGDEGETRMLEENLNRTQSWPNPKNWSTVLGCNSHMPQPHVEEVIQHTLPVGISGSCEPVTDV
jgi:hypothetical protein